MKDKKSVYVIAEMACSHEGNPDLAKKIIDGAGKAGADAIQFQIWALSDIMVPHHPEYEKCKKIELSYKIWAELADFVRKQYPEMQIIACVYERNSVDFAQSINVDAYKIHSADLSNPYLVKYVAKKDKRIDLSIGASTLDEIQTAVEWIKSDLSSNIWLMYGYQNFPTPIADVNMGFMMMLGQLFNLPVGYQDHSDAGSDTAFWLPAAAVGMGVDVLEKHITHDRSHKGIDHEAALNPDEFARFVKMVREIETASGVSVPRPFSAAEIKYRKYSKKSLVANRDLPEGAVVKEDDLIYLRADDLGLPPDQSWRLVGRKTKQPISKYHLILEENVV